MVNEEQLIQQIEYLCRTGISNESIQEFIIRENLFVGNSDSEIAANYSKKIAGWKEHYYIQSEDITLYGVLCWYFDISFNEIYASEQDLENICFYFLKLWLVYMYKESDIMNFKSGTDWTWPDRFKAYELNSLEVNQSYRLTGEELIKDLEEFYNLSLARFEHYKNETANNPKVVKQLTPQYTRYMEYVTNYRESLKDCRVLRINKLGHYEEQGNYEEGSWYFVIGEERMYFVVLSDFA